MNHIFDTIVIGSGIGGLAAATAQSRMGYRVLLLEAGAQYGGYLNPFKRSGFTFCPGLHYVGESGKDGRFSSILSQLGIEDQGFTEMDPDGFDEYRFPGYTFKMPKGSGVYREKLLRDFPHERPGIHRLIDLIDTVMATVKHVQNFQGMTSFTQLLRGVLRMFPWRKATLSELLDDFIRDPLLRSVVSAACGNAGLPPSRLSGLYHLLVISHYLNGAYVPVGGSGAIRDALLKEFFKNGGLAQKKSPVKHILTQNGGISGVITEKGTLFQGNTVISNAQGPATYSMVDRQDLIKPAIKWKQRTTRHSLGSVMLFIGLKKDFVPHELGRSNVWHYDSVDIEESYRAQLEGRLSGPNSFFLHSPTIKDPEGALAPEGHHSLEMVALSASEPFKPFFDEPVMRRSEDYKSLKNIMAEAYLKAVSRYVPEIHEQIEVLEVATPATNHSFTRSAGGNIYGPDMSPRQTFLGRFMPRGQVPGLFLCGSSVIGCGVTPAATSGMISSKLASRYLKAARSQRATAVA